ncbi:NAD kinase [Lapidilactobacillus wuchangensis]|uniref:NAD kinase n=1 Tax=Lapidilactobacillus wuchangensis TaxID=2486001 RepID=UPI000F7BA452|nr:NAD kinase [Lapidilactobacillus wuchangensis]
MKIAVLGNRGNQSQRVTAELKQRLINSGHTLDEHQPELVISVGGDGTLLNSFHRYNHQLDQVRFIGVHTGHLGFYTDWRDYELPELVQSINEDQGQSVSYPLLSVEVEYQDQAEPSHFLSLNESTIRRNALTIKTDIYIRDELFESFRGDGICVATPTGSTAYSKSLGGAVLHPRLEALQMTEIASINNRVFRTLSSPIVIAPDEWITIKASSAADYTLTVDQMSSHNRSIKQIKYSIANERIRFAKYRHMHFWSRVEDAFLGNVQQERRLTHGI